MSGQGDADGAPPCPDKVKGALPRPDKVRPSGDFAARDYVGSGEGGAGGEAARQIVGGGFSGAEQAFERLDEAAFVFVLRVAAAST